MDEDDVVFSWDPDKAAANLIKHRVAFEDATFIFDDPRRIEREDRFAVGELRTIVIGVVDGVTLTVIYAEPEEGHYRIISARRASAAERRAYEDNHFHS